MDAQSLPFGAFLARLEATIAFGRLPARFPGLAPAPDTVPIRRDRIVLRGCQSLPTVLKGSEEAGI
ncbi:hypothetical protein JS756_33620 [Streptomyces actuosus]|uniref:Uncharacterized protein n=1 Tax=Streptomyces actuosus TaxID=1885 RepID=A0ABS2W0L0_STRAS|nr:hypothetical protein [Streptomyces actuosus]MBN0048941.1 hypothetical protein [Streptomyces actuosus]